MVRVPKPSIATEIVDPAGIAPIPAGVPVRITSPGSKVITLVTNSIICGILKIISERFDDCFTSPFKVAVIPWSAGTFQSRPGLAAASRSVCLRHQLVGSQLGLRALRT